MSLQRTSPQRRWLANCWALTRMSSRSCGLMSSSAPWLVSARVRSSCVKPRRWLGSGSLVRLGCGLVWVAAAGEMVEQQAGQDHQASVGSHWPEGELHTELRDGRAADHGRDRHRATGRMQAAQREHGADGQRPRDARSQSRVAQQQCAGDAHQGRDRVAANEGPGLGERAGRHRKQQHRRRAHRDDEPGVECAQGQPAEPFGDQQAETRAEHPEGHFPSADAQRFGNESAEPGQEGGHAAGLQKAGPIIVGSRCAPGGDVLISSGDGIARRPRRPARAAAGPGATAGAGAQPTRPWRRCSGAGRAGGGTARE